jgi:putative phage-type endonuclease
MSSNNNVTSIKADDRKTFIGGTDIGAIFEMNQYKSPMRVWQEKIGKVEPEDISEKLSVKLGIYLEPMVMEEFSKITGLTVNKNYDVFRHQTYNFIGGTPDAFGDGFILEVKTTSAYNSKQWDNDCIPEAYELQLLHYLLVTGIDTGYIACLIGNNEIVIRKRIITDKQKNLILQKCIEFWEYVKCLKEPPVDASIATNELLNKTYQNSIPNTKELCTNDNIIKNYHDLVELKAKKKQIENSITSCENVIKDYMKETEILYINDENLKVSWKTQTKTRLDIDTLKKENPEIYNEFLKSYTSRVFLV